MQKYGTNNFKLKYGIHTISIDYLYGRGPDSQVIITSFEAAFNFFGFLFKDSPFLQIQIGSISLEFDHHETPARRDRPPNPLENWIASRLLAFFAAIFVRTAQLDTGKITFTLNNVKSEIQNLSFSYQRSSKQILSHIHFSEIIVTAENPLVRVPDFSITITSDTQSFKYILGGMLSEFRYSIDELNIDYNDGQMSVSSITAIVRVRRDETAKTIFSMSQIFILFPKFDFHTKSISATVNEISMKPGKISTGPMMVSRNSQSLLNSHSVRYTKNRIEFEKLDVTLSTPFMIDVSLFQRYFNNMSFWSHFLYRDDDLVHHHNKDLSYINNNKNLDYLNNKFGYSFTKFDSTQLLITAPTAVLRFAYSDNHVLNFSLRKFSYINKLITAKSFVLDTSFQPIEHRFCECYRASFNFMRPLISFKCNSGNFFLTNDFAEASFIQEFLALFSFVNQQTKENSEKNPIKTKNYTNTDLNTDINTDANINASKKEAGKNDSPTKRHFVFDVKKLKVEMRNNDLISKIHRSNEAKRLAIEGLQLRQAKAMQILAAKQTNYFSVEDFEAKSKELLFDLYKTTYDKIKFKNEEDLFVVDSTDFYCSFDGTKIASRSEGIRELKRTVNFNKFSNNNFADTNNTNDNDIDITKINEDNSIEIENVECLENIKNQKEIEIEDEIGSFHCGQLTLKSSNISIFAPRIEKIASFSDLKTDGMMFICKQIARKKDDFYHFSISCDKNFMNFNIPGISNRTVIAFNLAVNCQQSYFKFTPAFSEFKQDYKFGTLIFRKKKFLFRRLRFFDNMRLRYRWKLNINIKSLDVDYYSKYYAFSSFPLFRIQLPKFNLTCKDNDTFSAASESILVKILHELDYPLFLTFPNMVVNFKFTSFNPLKENDESANGDIYVLIKKNKFDNSETSSENNFSESRIIKLKRRRPFFIPISSHRMKDYHYDPYDMHRSHSFSFDFEVIFENTQHKNATINLDLLQPIIDTFVKNKPVNISFVKPVDFFHKPSDAPRLSSLSFRIILPGIIITMHQNKFFTKIKGNPLNLSFRFDDFMEFDQHYYNFNLVNFLAHLNQGIDDNTDKNLIEIVSNNTKISATVKEKLLFDISVTEFFFSLANDGLKTIKIGNIESEVCSRLMKFVMNPVFPFEWPKSKTVTELPIFEKDDEFQALFTKKMIFLTIETSITKFRLKNNNMIKSISDHISYEQRICQDSSVLDHKHAADINTQHEAKQDMDAFHYNIGNYSVNNLNEVLDNTSKLDEKFSKSMKNGGKSSSLNNLNSLASKKSDPKSAFTDNNLGENDIKEDNNIFVTNKSKIIEEIYVENNDQNNYNKSSSEKDINNNNINDIIDIKNLDNKYNAITSKNDDKALDDKMNIKSGSNNYHNGNKNNENKENEIKGNIIKHKNITFSSPAKSNRIIPPMNSVMISSFNITTSSGIPLILLHSPCYIVCNSTNLSYSHIKADVLAINPTEEDFEFFIPTIKKFIEDVLKHKKIKPPHVTLFSLELGQIRIGLFDEDSTMLTSLNGDKFFIKIERTRERVEKGKALLTELTVLNYKEKSSFSQILVTQKKPFFEFDYEKPPPMMKCVFFKSITMNVSSCVLRLDFIFIKNLLSLFPSLSTLKLLIDYDIDENENEIEIDNENENYILIDDIENQQSNNINNNNNNNNNGNNNGNNNTGNNTGFNIFNLFCQYFVFNEFAFEISLRRKKDGAHGDMPDRRLLIKKIEFLDFYGNSEKFLEEIKRHLKSAYFRSISSLIFKKKKISSPPPPQ